jgi:hypothetical protein
MKIKVDIEDVTWQCGDCGNRYEYRVMYCPNQNLDLWMLKATKK